MLTAYPFLRETPIDIHITHSHSSIALRWEMATAQDRPLFQRSFLPVSYPLFESSSASHKGLHDPILHLAGSEVGVREMGRPVAPETVRVKSAWYWSERLSTRRTCNTYGMRV